jgi:LysM repeat protein
MSPEPISSTKVCPTCGTRVSENATRCLVCGRTFTGKSSPPSTKPIQGAHLPEVTLSLPFAVGLILITLAIGAGLIFLILRGTGQVAGPVPTATATITPTLEQTLTPTTTPTFLPTYTLLPPKEHTVQSGENCGLIALTYGVSIQSITELNNLPPDCGVLTIGQKIKVPQPTPTASPMPTTTLSIAQKTETSCQKLEVRVGENDTLGGIAANYAVAVDTLKTYNGLTSNTIYVGQIIKIPLCQRLPTPGPTPTPTLPPPYAPTNLLLPADGSTYGGTNDSVTLQWAAIGGMREGESYAVNIEDLSTGEGKKLVDYTADTKYIVPVTFRPTDTAIHIIRWWIQPVRQSGTTKEGQQIWVPAGASSVSRVFGWSGIGGAVTPSN